MDSGVVHSRVHDEYGQEHSHNVGLQLGGDEQHHDIKSVLKKAKAKAKRIKDTITKNRHGHDHDHDHDGYRDEGQNVPDDQGSYEDDDDEDEGTVEVPDVHGAPVYESAAVKSAQVENLGHPGVNVGGTTVTGEEHHQEPRTVVVSSSAESNLNRGTESAGTLVGEDKTRQNRVNLDRPMGLDEDSHAPGSRAEAYNPSNYQTKITNPTGAGSREFDTASIGDSLARTNIHNEPKPNTVLPIGSGIQYPSAGSHNQFSPEPTHTPKNTARFPEYPQETGKTFDTLIEPEEHPRYDTTEKPSIQSNYTEEYEYPLESDKTFDFMTQPKEYPHYETLEKPPTQSSYTDKDSSATSAIPDKSVSDKSVVASNLGYREKSDREENEMKHEEHKIGEETPPNQGSYTEKISSATSAIADKAISAKNIVASKLGYGERDDRENEMKHEEQNIGEKKPLNSSSYTEKISSATSAVADKAISAKNVVTSKLGYGEKGDRDNKETTHVEQHESGDAAKKPEPTLEYGKKIASTVTEKLAPVYGTVAGAGSAIMSKMPGIGTPASTDSGTETEDVVPKQDKGVSLKDYLAERLRPGDEDRALSEVISEAYHKQKKDPTGDSGSENRPVKEEVADAIHKQEEKPEKAEQPRPMGKVTESEEVKRYLGTGKDEKGNEESQLSSSGKGVVDKLKGAVGSWFGKELNKCPVSYVPCVADL